MTELILSDGKYHFIANDDGTELRCLRFGEHWREFIGDKAIHCLYTLALDQQQRIADLEQKLTDLRVIVVVHVARGHDQNNELTDAIERSHQ